MESKDIVYILKKDVKPEELRYSLRSVEKNFPHRYVWFFGGKPEGIEPDVYVEVKQTGGNKWERVRNTYRVIAKTEDLTEEFYLFNDDFYVLKKVRYMKPLVRGTIARRVQEIREKHDSVYAQQLAAAASSLRLRGMERLDYAVHAPMLFEKSKVLETLEKFPENPMFRSLYGNHHSVGGMIVEDCKIQDLEQLPKKEWTFASSNDKTFAQGALGEYIRNKFKEASRFETNG